MSFYFKKPLDGMKQPCQRSGTLENVCRTSGVPTTAGFFVPVKLDLCGRDDIGEYKTGGSQEYPGRLAYMPRVNPGLPLKEAGNSNLKNVCPMKTQAGRKAESCCVSVSLRFTRQIKVSLSDDTERLLLFYEAYRSLPNYPCYRPVLAFLPRVQAELASRGEIGTEVVA